MWLPVDTVLDVQSVLVNDVDGVFSMPPNTIRVQLDKDTLPSVSKAAAPKLFPLALPGPLRMTTPPVWVNAPLLSMPSVSPLVGTSTSKYPPETLTEADSLPWVALMPSSVALT